MVIFELNCIKNQIISNELNPRHLDPKPVQTLNLNYLGLIMRSISMDLEAEMRVNLTRQVQAEMRVSLTRQVQAEMRVSLTRQVQAEMRVSLTRQVQAEMRVSLTRQVQAEMRVSLTRHLQAEMRVSLTRQVQQSSQYFFHYLLKHNEKEVLKSHNKSFLLLPGWCCSRAPTTRIARTLFKWKMNSSINFKKSKSMLNVFCL